jgi:hypothetical protein
MSELVQIYDFLRSRVDFLSGCKECHSLDPVVPHYLYLARETRKQLTEQDAIIWSLCFEELIAELQSIQTGQK